MKQKNRWTHIFCPKSKTQSCAGGGGGSGAQPVATTASSRAALAPPPPRLLQLVERLPVASTAAIAATSSEQAGLPTHNLATAADASTVQAGSLLKASQLMLLLT